MSRNGGLNIVRPRLSPWLRKMRFADLKPGQTPNVTSLAGGKWWVPNEHYAEYWERAWHDLLAGYDLYNGEILRDQICADGDDIDIFFLEEPKNSDLILEIAQALQVAVQQSFPDGNFKTKVLTNEPMKVKVSPEQRALLTPVTEEERVQIEQQLQTEESVLKKESLKCKLNRHHLTHLWKCGYHIIRRNVTVNSEIALDLREAKLQALLKAFGERAVPLNKWSQVLDRQIHFFNNMRQPGMMKALKCKHCVPKPSAKKKHKPGELSFKPAPAAATQKSDREHCHKCDGQGYRAVRRAYYPLFEIDDAGVPIPGSAIEDPRTLSATDMMQACMRLMPEEQILRTDYIRPKLAPAAVKPTRAELKIVEKGGKITKDEDDLLHEGDRKAMKRLPKVRHVEGSVEYQILSELVANFPVGKDRPWKDAKIREIRSDPSRRAYTVTLKSTNSNYCLNKPVSDPLHHGHSVKFVALRRDRTLGQECFCDCEISEAEHPRRFGVKCSEFRSDTIKIPPTDVSKLFPPLPKKPPRQRFSTTNYVSQYAPEEKEVREKTIATASKLSGQRNNDYWKALKQVSGLEAEARSKHKPELSLPSTLEVKDPTEEEIRKIIAFKRKIPPKERAQIEALKREDLQRKPCVEVFQHRPDCLWLNVQKFGGRPAAEVDGLEEKHPLPTKLINSGEGAKVEVDKQPYVITASALEWLIRRYHHKSDIKHNNKRKSEPEPEEDDDEHEHQEDNIKEEEEQEEMDQDNEDVEALAAG